MKRRKIIFHYPAKLNKNYPAGSQIRPARMLEAFEQIGYDVYCIMGDVNTRKKQIKSIKKRISNGVEFDFVYSESTTIPTALTEKHHLPIAPFLDFKFFRLCKNNNIPIGLFYRDIYWKFPMYDTSVVWYKRVLSKFFYRYDLRKYNKYINTMFLPTIDMSTYVKEYIGNIRSLPPAYKKIYPSEKNEESGFLYLFYIGGLGGIYDFNEIIEVIQQIPKIRLIICTREKEWQKFVQDYPELNISKVEIHHKSGKELIPLYQQVDICLSYFKPDEYWSFAMGVKNFEYLSFEKPILTAEKTAIGDFVKKNNIGWQIPYGKDSFLQLLNHLSNHPLEIQQKRMAIREISNDHFWTNRAKKVEQILKANK